MAKVLNDFMNHEPIKITISIIDILFSNFKWRARHHTPALAVVVTTIINEVVTTLRIFPGPVPPIDLPI